MKTLYYPSVAEKCRSPIIEKLRNIYHEAPYSERCTGNSAFRELCVKMNNHPERKELCERLGLPVGGQMHELAAKVIVFINRYGANRCGLGLPDGGLGLRDEAIDAAAAAAKRQKVSRALALDITQESEEMIKYNERSGPAPSRRPWVQQPPDFEGNAPETGAAGVGHRTQQKSKSKQPIVGTAASKRLAFRTSEEAEASHLESERLLLQHAQSASSRDKASEATSSPVKPLPSVERPPVQLNAAEVNQRVEDLILFYEKQGYHFTKRQLNALRTARTPDGRVDLLFILHHFPVNKDRCRNAACNGICHSMLIAALQMASLGLFDEGAPAWLAGDAHPGVAAWHMGGSLNQAILEESCRYACLRTQKSHSLPIYLPQLSSPTLPSTSLIV